jgi:hypothetical protein
MLPPTAEAKVLNFAQEQVISQLANWTTQLIAGRLRQVEHSITTLASKLSDVVLSLLLPAAAQHHVERQKVSSRNVVERPLIVRLRSGHQVEVPSLYDKRPSGGGGGGSDGGHRHHLARHWSVIGGASPGRYDAIAYAAVSLPSYDLSQCLLTRHGVKTCTSGVRDLTNKVAARARQLGEAELLLRPKETLAGKRVVISSDGGRTLTRQANGELSPGGRARFDARWREPKLFVIEVIDKDGKSCCQHLPIYGCRFSDTDHLALLRHYLVHLEIEQAAEVQLIADGASWIWNKIPAMLEQLGVKGQVTTQTLDYYHAVQHLEELFKTLPARIGKRQRTRWWKRCKEWLWRGQSRGIVRLFSRLYQRFPAAMRTELNYFTKHRQRMYYADYESRKLLCGSGIVESAVRRVINLRYKNTSTFWDMDTVEKLYFLRGAVLSKRWDVVMKNLTD